jgi:hypothetical protein
MASGAALAQPAAADDDIRGLGTWVSWREQLDDPTRPPHLPGVRMQVQAGGHLIAAVDGFSHLRVWTIGEGGQLGRQVWDSAGLASLVTDLLIFAQGQGFV